MAIEKATEGARIAGKSGATCSEIVRENRMEKPQTHLKNVQGPKFSKGGSRTPKDSFGYSGNRLRSCGFGPSKTFAREGLPKNLNEVHFGIIKMLDDVGPLSTEELISAFDELEDGEVESALKDMDAMRKTAKVDALTLSEKKGGWVFMAEGRRIAGELAEDDG